MSRAFETNRLRSRLVVFAVSAMATSTWLAVACFVKIPNVVEGGETSVDATNTGDTSSCANLALFDPVDAHCPSSPDDGPMVALRWPDGGVYCIDATEVKSRDYIKLYDTPSFKQVFNGRECVSNDGGQQAAPNLPPSPFENPTQEPAVINWCEADAFCRFVGRRLCRTSGDKLDPNASEWFRACSPDGRDYPFGPGVDTAAAGCSYVQPLSSGGSRPCCVGSVRGLFDMSGSVAEWTRECSSQNADASCVYHALRGGSMRKDADALRETCAYLEPPNTPNLQRTNTGDIFAGVRCCADPL